MVGHFIFRILDALFFTQIVDGVECYSDRRQIFIVTSKKFSAV